MQLSCLPVGLRYRLDTWNFRENNEELYYKTVGVDHWLMHLHEGLVALVKWAEVEFRPKKPEGMVISGEKLMKEIFEPRNLKYRPKE